jgi:hypothetical protein
MQLSFRPLPRPERGGLHRCYVRTLSDLYLVEGLK